MPRGGNPFGLRRDRVARPGRAWVPRGGPGAEGPQAGRRRRPQRPRRRHAAVPDRHARARHPQGHGDRREDPDRDAPRLLQPDGGARREGRRLGAGVPRGPREGHRRRPVPQAHPTRRGAPAGACAAAEGQRLSTPREDGLRMPAEWAPHERTLMAWPARAELWGAQLAQAKADYAATAKAVASFEPLTMVCADETAAAEARSALPGEVEVVVEPIDDSWLRDSGPIFVTSVDPPGRRAGVHFGFNAWGEKFHPYDRDAALGGRLVELIGDPCYRAPLVLEGGSICADGEGTLLTTEQCLLHPSRNPGLSRDEIERHLCEQLGLERV